MSKKILASAFLFTFLLLTSNAIAIPLTSLKIQNVGTPAYEWNTLDGGWFTPIGVLVNPSDPIVQFGTGSKSIDGKVNIGSGESIYLYTEAFSFNQTVFEGLFKNQLYTLTIVAGADTYSLGFGFDGSLSFVAPSSTTPFALNFLGFTGAGTPIANDLVRPFDDTTLGLIPDGNADAVYQLTYSAVPEPATLLLLGSGLIGLAVAGRKLRK